MLEIVAAPVIGGLVGFLVWFIQNRISKIQAERNDLMDKRREVYADLLEPFIRIHAGPQDPAEIAEATEQLKSLNFKRKAFQFSLLAEDCVIRAFNDMIEYIASFGDQSVEKPDPNVISKKWGIFMLELRRSFGNQDTTLTEREIRRCLLNKLDE